MRKIKAVADKNRSDDSLVLLGTLINDQAKLSDVKMAVDVFDSAATEIKRLRIENSLLKGGLVHISNAFRSSNKPMHEKLAIRRT